MANLIYSAIVSLDGYVADAEGRFDWSMPDHEVHAAINDLVRDVGTYLYGRRLYEVMGVWQDMGGDPDEAAEVNDFAEIWRSADKVVYSTTLHEVHTSRTRLERAFDADAIRAMKAAVRAGHRDRRADPGRPRVPSGTRRRPPPVHLAHARRGWNAGAA